MILFITRCKKESYFCLLNIYEPNSFNNMIKRLVMLPNGVQTDE